MFIYQYKERRRKKSHSSNYVHHHPHCYHRQYITFTSSFLVQLFIATTIMATSPDTSVAMNVLNDRIHVHEEFAEISESQVRSSSIENHQIILNEKQHYPSKVLQSSSPSLSSSSSSTFKLQKLNAKGQSTHESKADEIKAHHLMAKHVLNKDQSNGVHGNLNERMCNCSHGMWKKFQSLSCIEICSINRLHSKKLKRKRKLTKRISMVEQERSECFTLIYQMNEIGNSTPSNKIIVPNQSSDLMKKFQTKPRQQQIYGEITANNDAKVYETIKHNQMDSSATNFHRMDFHSELASTAPPLHLLDFKNIDTKNNRPKNNASLHDKNVDKTIVGKSKTIDSNSSRNVKRMARSIATKVPSKQFSTKTWTKWQTIRQQNATLSATKVSSTRVSAPENAVIDSSNPKGEVVEINATVLNANRAINSTTSNKSRTLEDVDVEVDDGDHVNYTLQKEDTFENLAMNWYHSELFVEMPLKSDYELATRTFGSFNEDNTTTQNTTYEMVDGNITTVDTLNASDQNNGTCPGAQEYCNYTEAQYRQMLFDYLFPTPGEWLLIGFHTIVFLVGLIGNILVCIAVYANATMRTVTNIFIVNLAIADLLVIILCLPPTVLWDISETWFLGESMCKGILYLQTVSVTVSVLTLTFISVDRWYAICFPLRYVSTNGRAWCSVGLIWIGALLSDIPEFINSTIQKKPLRFDIELFTQCVSGWDKDFEKNWYIGRFAVLYVLPLILMSIAYFKIICVLWKSDTIPGHRESCSQMHTIHARNTVGNSSTIGQLRARRKAAKMLVVVVLMFAICYLPVHCLNIARYTFNIDQNEIVTMLSLISHLMAYANSAINPLIYNFMSGKFRREFVHVLDRCRCNDREVHRHYSYYFNTPGTRLNTIRPNARLCHFVNHRDRSKSFREKNTVQTSFIENFDNIYPGNIDENKQFGITTNGASFSRTIPNDNRKLSSMD